MSLYDELLVEYPLPDGFDPTGHLFQTTDTPDQYGSLYTLCADGTVVTSLGEPVALHGRLTFYTGNVCATGPQGYATEDDQPAWRAAYVCLFDHGHLLKIEGEKRLAPDRYRGPHLTRAAWDAARFGEQETPHGPST